VSPEERKQERHSVALWAALVTFFTNLAAINFIAVIGAEDKPLATAVAAIVTGAAAAIAVYAKERLNEAKRERERE
jgi:uncharacterized membrane protein